MDAARSRRRPLLVAASLGAAWGLLAYSVLWGFTPLVVQRAFVVSPIGTLLLLPARIVLWLIHWAENVAGRAFEFSENHWWIGLAAGIVGAGVVAALALLIRLGTRAFGHRGSAGERIAKPPERL